MLKNISRLETVINNKIFHLTCDMDSPINDVKESLFQFLKYVGKIEDQIKIMEEKKAQDQKIPEEKKEEPVSNGDAVSN